MKRLKKEEEKKTKFCVQGSNCVGLHRVASFCIAMICIQVTFLPCIWPYLKCMGFILLHFVVRFGSSSSIGNSASSYKCGSTFIMIIRCIYRLARARCGNFKNRKDDDISGCSLITYAIGTKVVCDTREFSFSSGFIFFRQRKRRGPEVNVSVYLCNIQLERSLQRLFEKNSKISSRSHPRFEFDDII